ncbi:MAG: NUDIX domain-containing protein [Patescibacteria group bacterium]
MKLEHAHFPIREDGPPLIEVHVAGVCVRQDAGRWKVLGAKRSRERSLFPGHWECGGGSVLPGESFEAAIKRQIFEELGLAIEPRQILEAYSIHVPTEQRVIPGIRFLCLANKGAVKLNFREFSSFRWFDLPLRQSVPWIPGIKEVLDRVGEDLGTTKLPPARVEKSPVGFVQPSRSTDTRHK